MQERERHARMREDVRDQYISLNESSPLQKEQPSWPFIRRARRGWLAHTTPTYHRCAILLAGRSHGRSLDPSSGCGKR